MSPAGLPLETRIALGSERDENGCLLWVGTVLLPDGYARFTWKGKKQLVHRVVWSAVHGEIPEGWQVDHLCRVRNCVEITHLEAVPAGENLFRSSKGFTLTGYCVSGKHKMNGPEDWLDRTSFGQGRVCRYCARERAAEWRERQRNT